MHLAASGQMLCSEHSQDCVAAVYQWRSRHNRGELDRGCLGQTQDLNGMCAVKNRDTEPVHFILQCLHPSAASSGPTAACDARPPWIVGMLA